MIGEPQPERPGPEALAAEQVLALLEAIRSGEDSAPDEPASAIVVTFLASVLRMADGVERAGHAAEAAATHLSTIAAELREAKAFRERERRGGR